MEKEEARRTAREAIKRMTGPERSLASARITERVTKLPEFIEARTVMVFLPILREVDTRGIARKALVSGKRVVTPRVDPKRRLMAAHVVGNLASDVAPGHCGIPEPVRRETVDPSRIDFVLVPGLAFGRHGSRLGRGAGYYDRFFASHGFTGFKCAVAFACQILKDVPIGDKDVPMSCIVNEKEVIYMR